MLSFIAVNYNFVINCKLFIHTVAIPSSEMNTVFVIRIVSLRYVYNDIRILIRCISIRIVINDHSLLGEFGNIFKYDIFCLSIPIKLLITETGIYRFSNIFGIGISVFSGLSVVIVAFVINSVSDVL